MDKNHLEAIQRELSDYKGARYFADAERQNHALHVRLDQMRHRFEREYLFSILVPAYETDETYLTEMMDSVMRQTYGKVELVVADASKSDRVERAVERYKQTELAAVREENRLYHTPYGDRYPEIRYIRLEQNGGISANTNQALRAAQGDYIGLLDHDDVLTYDALYEVMCRLSEKPYEIVYTDEDKADGRLETFHTPNRKPDFNLAYLLSNNYICHFMIMKASLIRSLGFRPECDGAQDYDLILRAVTDLSGCAQGRQCRIGRENVARLKARISHVDKILYHWRCHERSTADNPESKRYAYEAGKTALEEFCQVHGMDATVSHSAHLGYYKLTAEAKPWDIYPAVGAVCGRVVKEGEVVAGPMLGKKELFAGLKEGYAGYMNRAAFPIEVDSMDDRAALFTPAYEEYFRSQEERGRVLSFEQKMDYVREQGDCFLYLPDFEACYGYRCPGGESMPHL